MNTEYHLTEFQTKFLEIIVKRIDWLMLWDWRKYSDKELQLMAKHKTEIQSVLSHQGYKEYDRRFLNGLSKEYNIKVKNYGRS